MNVRLESLDLVFKDARVAVRFSPELTFVHGQVGTGKSSVARLIDWCLGGDMDFTPALEDELVSAGLHLTIGSHAALIVRDREDKSHVRLSWSADNDEPHNEVVPLKGSASDWDPDSPQTLGDHLFVLAGVTPLRVPKARSGDDSTLQRLSFRDFLAFCYLPQESLNVSLLRFGEAFSGRKSEDVMRAILGLFSERQQRLQAQAESLQRKSSQSKSQAEEVAAFLDRLEIDRLDDIEAQLLAARQELEEAGTRKHVIDADPLPSDHPSVPLRQRLQALETEIVGRREAINDIEEQIARDGRLRAELITAQLKLDRSAVAVEVLGRVHYGHCPQCGSHIDPPDDDNCHLCRNQLAAEWSPPADAQQLDLQVRIDELAASVERHSRARARDSRHLRDREDRRAALDAELAEMLRDYESVLLASARDVERRLATARGDIARLESALRLREEVRRLTEQSARLLGERAPVLQELNAENDRLAEREQYRDVIAAAFLEALLAVGMPDVTPGDEVSITNKLVPWVTPASGRAGYSFKNLGSSGMKTLFQCCYALALHRVAAEHDLLLPRFLIIDTPTQNVDERVDNEIFHGFFRYLYGLLEGEMSSVQVVLIDSDVEPPPAGIALEDLMMSRDDAQHPRLVPYYLALDEAQGGVPDVDAETDA